MYLIVACSFVALAVVVERFLHLAHARTRIRAVMAQVRTPIQQQRIREAIGACERTAGPLAGILRAGMLKHGRSREEIREAMEEASRSEVPKLERNLGILATIAHTAPLLGLLGTVLGMLRAFQAIEAKASIFQPVSPGDLAGGIGSALITTAGGLIVAIPTFVAYNYFVSRVGGIVVDMERGAADLANLLTESKA